MTVRNAYGTKCIHLPIHSIDAPQNFDCLGNLVVLSLNLCVAWNILDSSKSTIHCAKMSIWQHPCHSHRSHLESIKVLVEMRASSSAEVQAVSEAFSLSASQFRHRLHFRRSAADNKDKVRKILRICSTLHICKAVESKQLPQLVQKALSICR